MSRRSSPSFAQGGLERPREVERPVVNAMVGEFRKALAPFARFADSMDQLGHDADMEHLIRVLEIGEFWRAREAFKFAGQVMAVAND